MEQWNGLTISRGEVRLSIPVATAERNSLQWQPHKTKRLSKIMRKKTNGHSSIEILIVLLIILSLGCVLASASFTTREAIRTKSCATNVKQLSNALSLYTHDYDGTYPAFSTGSFKSSSSNPKVASSYKGSVWSELLSTYINTNDLNILRCPSADQDALPKGTRIHHALSYAYNINLSEATYDTYLRTKNVQGNPDYKLTFESHTVVLTDARLGIIALGGPDETDLNRLNALYPRKLKTQISRQRLGATRHQGGANYAFADGHVKWFKPEQISVDKKCDGKTPGFGL